MFISTMKNYAQIMILFLVVLASACSKNGVKERKAIDSQLVESLDVSFQTVGLDLIQVIESDNELTKVSGQIWLARDSKPYTFARTTSREGEIRIEVTGDQGLISSVVLDNKAKVAEIQTSQGIEKIPFGSLIKRKGSSAKGVTSDLLPIMLEFELADLAASATSRKPIADPTSKRQRPERKSASSCETTFMNIAATKDEAVYQSAVEMSSFMTAYGCSGSINCGESSPLFFGFVIIRVCNAHLSCDVCPW